MCRLKPVRFPARINGYVCRVEFDDGIIQVVSAWAYATLQVSAVQSLIPPGRSFPAFLSLWLRPSYEPWKKPPWEFIAAAG